MMVVLHMPYDIGLVGQGNTRECRVWEESAALTRHGTHGRMMPAFLG